MEKYLNVLRKCILFLNMNDQEILQLMDCFQVSIQTYKKKEMIISQNDDVNSIGIIVSGSAKIEKNDYEGNRNIVGILSPSDLFLETFVCGNIHQVNVDVEANEESEILFIEYQKIISPCIKRCTFHHKLMLNLIQVLANKNYCCHQKLDILSKKTTKEKLLTYLMQEANRQNNHHVLIPFNRQELADYLQVDRSGLSMIISTLCKEGIIKVHKKYFTIYF